MKAKTYRYFVSFYAQTPSSQGVYDIILEYGEPADTPDMLMRMHDDIIALKYKQLAPVTTVSIIFFKRIKNNREVSKK